MNDFDAQRDQVYKEILDLFSGNKAEADRWISEPVWGLNNKAPKELFNSPQGIAKVRTLVGRLKHGIPT